jgi:hypothetical protein
MLRQRWVGPLAARHGVIAMNKTLATAAASFKIGRPMLDDSAIAITYQPHEPVD